MLTVVWWWRTEGFLCCFGTLGDDATVRPGREDKEREEAIVHQGRRMVSIWIWVTSNQR